MFSGVCRRFLILTSQTVVNRTQANQALEHVLGSRIFARADRSRRFLSYLMESAFAQPPIAVKEYTIALDVFDRDNTYDPSIDATVRVEASRLRARLREYYLDEGRNDDFVIEVPKGSYAAVLHDRRGREAISTETSVSPSEEQSADAPSLERHVPANTSGRERRSWTALAALVSVLALLVVMVLVVVSRTRRAPVGGAQPAHSLAILPIVNRTGDPAYDFLCDGLTDDLIRQLSQLPAVRLISRNAVFRLRRTNADPLETGKMLGVGAVLTGELRRTPDHTSLLAELTNTIDGAVLLDHEYIVENGDLRSVQADLQRNLIDKLHLEGSALDPGRTLPSVTSSPGAYREFLQGDALARGGEPGNLHGAIEHFERAVQLDPEFDLAWSAMASAHLYLGIYFEAPRDHMPQARLFAERALKLNPALGEAHGSLGLIHLVYDWSPSAAAAEMTTAGAQEAAISTLTCTAHLIGEAGSHRSAEEMLTRMLTYDPNSASLIGELGCVEYYQGRYDTALRRYREALAADPRSPVPYWGAGKTLNAKHDYAEALAVLNTFRQRNGFEPPLLAAERGYALGRAGRFPEATAVAQNLIAEMKHSYVDPYLVAVIYASMDDRKQALTWLNKAIEARSPFIISLASEPKWDAWRSDPRFTAMIKRCSSERQDDRSARLE